MTSVQVKAGGGRKRWNVRRGLLKGLDDTFHRAIFAADILFDIFLHLVRDAHQTSSSCLCSSSPCHHRRREARSQSVHWVKDPSYAGTDLTELSQPWQRERLTTKGARGIPRGLTCIVMPCLPCDDDAAVELAILRWDTSAKGRLSECL
jgi:hypothetical protein